MLVFNPIQQNFMLTTKESTASVEDLKLPSLKQDHKYQREARAVFIAGELKGKRKPFVYTLNARSGVLNLAKALTFYCSSSCCAEPNRNIIFIATSQL